MNELLATIIETHGGMDRWNSFDKVEVTIISGCFGSISQSLAQVKNCSCRWKSSVGPEKKR
jgi:hypothetical protein